MCVHPFCYHCVITSNVCTSTYQVICSRSPFYTLEDQRMRVAASHPSNLQQNHWDKTRRSYEQYKSKNRLHAIVMCCKTNKFIIRQNNEESIQFNIQMSLCVIQSATLINHGWWLIDWLIDWLVFYGTSTQDRSICANLPEGITGSGV